MKSCTTEVKSKPIYFTEPGIPLLIPIVPGAQRGLVYPRKCLPVLTVIITDTICQHTELRHWGLMTVIQAIGRRPWNTGTIKLTTSEAKLAFRIQLPT